MKAFSLTVHPFALLLFAFAFMSHSDLQSQPVVWLSFEQLEDSLASNPKPVFIDFHTSWCTYCRKMDKRVFTKPEIEKILNEAYYSVKMDAESTDTIFFEGQPFLNSQATKKRAGIHDLALLLGQRNGHFSPPTMLLLDENFNVTGRYFGYLDSKQLGELLIKNIGHIHSQKEQ